MKKIWLISGWLLAVFFGACLILTNNKNNKEEVNNEEYKETNNSSNFLTMMLETEAGSGEYALSNSDEWPGDGYIFNSELSKCENGGILSWDSDTNRVVMQSNSSDKCYVYFDKEPDIVYLADYIKGLYTTDGENDLYYHDGVGTYENADQEAEDYSYRFSGANPNNYVCFGSDASQCPNDNLYRIIGAFDDDGDGTYNLKLIKYDYANSNLLGTNGYYINYAFDNTGSYYRGSLITINRYYLDGDNGIPWSNSPLNTTNLNSNYINSLGGEWSSLIAEHTWQVGGNTSTNILNITVKNAYINEIVTPATNTTYDAKIGLIYISDYGYAASPENWTVNMGSLNTTTNRDNNWMYMGLREWTITHRTDPTFLAFFVVDTGSVDTSWFADGYAVRPAFYLNSDVEYISGTGTQSDPIRLNHS